MRFNTMLAHQKNPKGEDKGRPKTKGSQKYQMNTDPTPSHKLQNNHPKTKKTKEVLNQKCEGSMKRQQVTSMMEDYQSPTNSSNSETLQYSAYSSLDSH